MYKRIILLFQDFFGISRKEARGALVLIVLALLILWVPFVFRRFVLPLVPPEEEPLTAQKLDSIVANLRKPDNPHRESKERFSAEKSIVRAPRYFRFDPNSATMDQLLTLGIPPFLVRRIDKFRSKGGKFRKKADLLHIYDFPPELYQKLESYIVLPASPAVNQRPFSADKANSPAPTVAVIKSRPPAVTAFDINTADTTQLVKLRGIGSKLSVRILKFRDGLGGFHSEDQFGEIYGLDSLALGELRKYAIISTPVKKIHINTANAEELGKHSYLKNKKLVSVIINYRNQHGNFNTPDDLLKTKVVDEPLVRKLEPYLVF